MENNTTIAQTLIDKFDEFMEEKDHLEADDKQKIMDVIKTREDLEDSLKELAKKNEDYKQNIDGCDKNIKIWQQSKKMWQIRQSTMLDILKEMMNKLAPGQKKLTKDGTKLSVSSRTSLEVNEEWLLQQYQMFADALQTQLPDYIKVSLSIDKTKLFSHVKEDESLLVQNPEMIHTKESFSTTLK